MATAWRLENGSVLNVAWIAAEANAIHDAALVLELAHRINERGLPIKIHAIGDTAGLFPMPVPSSVLIHGPVSYLDLPELLASMDVGLVLYNIKYDGGSPLKLFDYCSSGCVPICSPGQGIEKVLNGSGLISPRWWTADSLLEILDSLRNKPEKLSKMSAIGRQLILDEYNWETIAGTVDQIIRDAVSRRQ
jgi:glycosyltransferase involved in cell wall biosynthesis